jgi:hypothetical protein
MRGLLVVMVVVLAACGAETDDAAVTTAPPVTAADVSTTSTSPIATTTTTVATTTTTVPTTTTVAGSVIAVQVVEGEVTVEGSTTVPLGEEVTIRVTADVADEVHVHTYDLFADLEAGTPADITFVAEIPGVHEVELEGAGLLLLNLEVGG